MQRSRYFRIDWVLVDQLAIGPAPRAKRHLDRLRDAGIKCVLSLCSPDEATPAAGLGEGFRTSRYVLPDHRAGRLPTLAELETALGYLAELQQHDAEVRGAVRELAGVESGLKGELRAQLTAQTAEGVDFVLSRLEQELTTGALGHTAEWYNADEQLSTALAEMLRKLEAKARIRFAPDFKPDDGVVSEDEDDGVGLRCAGR